MKKLLLGNEAIARGAWQAGVRVCSSYPGTPSTEITENIAKYTDIYSEWAPNEKVAAEVAIGASIAGARSMCCMKHVGLNVAADPVLTAAYTGVRGGFVIVVADDPGMNSSQNEQDSRYYALMAHIPMLEPADSQECLDFMTLAFSISEQYDTPVFVRLTTRVAHSRSLVALGERTGDDLKPYEKDAQKYVMMPAMARERHIAVEQRMARLRQDCNTLPINFSQSGQGATGIVTSGIGYQYVKDALPEAPVFKLGMVYPLPIAALRAYAAQYDRLVVVEELEPFIEKELKAAGIACEGKNLFSSRGELGAADVAAALGGAAKVVPQAQDVAVRPPVMCPGCPHRGAFYSMKKLRLNVTGDIGCYTLGALAPLQSMDACICMGASIGMAMGFEKARGRDMAQKTVAVLGDSTFLHSGVTGLMNAVYNGGATTVMILDNSTTGMTGHQHNPSTGKRLSGDPAAVVDLEALCRSLGVVDVCVVDPFDLKAMDAALKAALAFDGPSVIIARRACALLPGVSGDECVYINPDTCRDCKICLRLGCPAIVSGADGMSIDTTLCNGCGLCIQVCPFGAIERQVR